MRSFKYLNTLGAKRIPFFFAINFKASEFIILLADESNADLAFDIDGIKSIIQPAQTQTPSITAKEPISFDKYCDMFNKLQKEISCGNTYLANLTMPTKISLNTTLDNVYAHTKAQFKIFVKNRFVSFSPERFIKIQNNIISTYPMKGTADKDSLHILLKSQKEIAEHAMSVDLLRNDLSMVANQIRLQSFRNATLIKAGAKHIWQTSSEITGILDNNWQDGLGDIFAKLLPAGSISGTPKQMSIKILHSIEEYDRGFFSGVFGYFGGDFLDSGVAIRFIEQTNDGFVYKSGGGITTNSHAADEYAEVLAKIYLPL